MWIARLTIGRVQIRLARHAWTAKEQQPFGPNHQDAEPAQPRRETVEIADAALRLIATEGIAALTVAGFAKELGLTGGALYRHFSSTDAILEAVAERAVELLDASLPDPSLSPLVWLEQFVESRTRAVSGHKRTGELDHFRSACQKHSETAFEHLRGAVRRTFVQVERALPVRTDPGQIRLDLSARELAPVVMGIVQMIALSRAGSLLGRVTNPERTWHAAHAVLGMTIGSTVLPLWSFRP